MCFSIKYSYSWTASCLLKEHCVVLYGLQQIDARWIYSLRNDYITYHMFKSALDLKALPKVLQRGKEKEYCTETRALLAQTTFIIRLLFIRAGLFAQ